MIEMNTSFDNYLTDTNSYKFVSDTIRSLKEYDEKIAHLAISRIAIDLDDGVKVNYEKVQTGQDGKKLGILGKI